MSNGIEHRSGYQKEKKTCRPFCFTQCRHRPQYYKKKNEALGFFLGTVHQRVRDLPKKKKNEFSNQYQFSIISHPQRRSFERNIFSCLHFFGKNVQSFYFDSPNIDLKLSSSKNLELFSLKTHNLIIKYN